MKRVLFILLIVFSINAQAQVELASGGSANAYTLAYPGVFTYSNGVSVTFKANFANTGAATININNLGAKTIKKQVSTDIAAGDILSGQVVTIIYDGTNFQMTSASGSSAAGGNNIANGTTPGQMLYWNGSSWVTVIPGTTGQTLTYCNGIPTWGTCPALATLTTTSASLITNITAISGGNISNDGNSPVTSRGICWATTANPTIANNFTLDGTGIGSFTSNLTNLTPNTLYYVRAYATTTAGTAYGAQISFTTLSLPTVTTSAISSITATTAFGGGNVTFAGGATVTANGLCWNTATGPTLANSSATGGTGLGSFFTTLTNLLPGTTYYVRAYATNSVGTAYGNEISFTTLNLPVLTTNTASLVTQTTAFSGGNITSQGDAPVTSRGVCWSTSPNPTTANSSLTSGSGTGSFGSDISGYNLTPNTVYYVRAYATSAAGTAYGNQISFTTLSYSPPTLTTLAVTSLVDATATSGGSISSDGNSNVTNRGVCYGTSTNPTTANFSTSNGTGIGSYSSSLVGLTPGTTYYIRAYATNTAGTAYGNELSFTTASLASITTTAITAIQSSSALSGGNVTADGGGIVTSRGVCWSTSTNPTTANFNTTVGSGTGSFTANITNLLANTTYYVRAFAINDAGTIYGNVISFTTSAASIPSVTTNAISAITSNSGQSGGIISANGGVAITSKGVCWNTASAPTIANPKTIDGTGSGSFSSAITGLIAGTTYYLRAYATNSIGTAYGNEITFVVPTLATVSTSAASAVLNTTATVGGNVTNEGSTPPVTARGICYSTGTNPTVTNSNVIIGSGLGTFSTNLSSLSPSTTYYVRAWAQNSAGYAYGNQISFTTAAISGPNITTNAITNITGNSATGGVTINDNGGSTITEYGICWSTNINPTTSNFGNASTSTVTNGSYSFWMGSLSIGTTYYVRAYAINGINITYGNQVSFTTSPIVLPSLTTTTATSILNTTATSGGNVTDIGSSSVNSRGVCWATSASPTIANNVVYTGAGVGVFTTNLTGLSPNTLYYARAFAINGQGVSYGNQITFTTLPASIPNITTNTISSLQPTYAYGGGVILDAGGSAITSKGVCWSTSPAPTTANPKTNNGTGTASFSSTISPLIAGTTYYLRAYATNTSGTAYGNEISFTTQAIPTITTTAVSSILSTTAISGGNVTTSVGGLSVTNRGICWNTSPNPTTSNNTVTSGSGLGVFSATPTALIANTTYYLRAWATNDAGTAYGNEITFTTLPMAKPTLTTTNVSNIYSTYSNSGGIITDYGGSAITAKGVCWSTSPNPIIANSFTNDGSGNSSYSSFLGSLLPGITYYVRAYATNGMGTGYGNEYSFTTLPRATLTTNSVTSILSASAVCGGNITAQGASAITNRGIYWGTSPNPSIFSISAGSGTGVFSANLTNLTANTTYYVRAFATNNEGTAYGNDVTFTTLGTAIPTVTTANISNLTNTTASSGGVLVDGGGSNILQQGVCWSTTTNPTIANNVTNNCCGSSFSSSITGLTGGTTYYVRAYATNGVGTAYGNEISFTALTLAALTTNAASSITATGAFCSGNVTAQGSSAVTVKGICWSTSSNPTTSNNSIGLGSGTGSFSTNLTNLSSNTIYYVRAYATNLSGTVYGNEVSFTTLPLAIISTDQISSILSNTATSGGNIISTGLSAVSNRGICWSTSINPTTANSTVSAGSGTGIFTGNLTGLTANTTYYVRAFATNSQGTAYGNQVTFTTLAPSLASLTTSAVSNISGTTAASGGSFLDGGGSSITAKGICWNTTPNPTTANFLTNVGSGNSNFTSSMSGLVAGTTYYVRAYATNAIGTSYGDEISFTTLSLPILTTTAASSILTQSAVSGGNITNQGGSSVSSRGVCWNTNPNPTTANSSVYAGSGMGTFTASLSNLTANTIYYVRAFATNSAGTAYGNQITFTTASLTLPVISTVAINYVSATSAYSGGTITDDGGSAISSKGVCWSTSTNPTIANSFSNDGTGSYNYSSYITPLIAGTTYYVRAYATNATGTAYGNEFSFTTPVLATLTTTAATSILSNSAISGGNITADGGYAITNRGICWSTSINPTTSNSTAYIGSGLGAYSATLTGLLPGTLYYVRSFAINNAGTAYGNQISFTTTAATIPSLVTSTINALNPTYAYSGGIISNNGGSAITVKGVCWSTSTGPTTANPKTNDGTGSTSFTSFISPLVSGTTYYVRAYATNAAGTAYGNEIIFKTPGLATLTTTAISGLTATSAISGGNITADGGYAVTYRGICYNTSPNPTTADFTINSNNYGAYGTNNYTTQTGSLIPSTTYYLRAFAQNSFGTAYGNQVSFTTPAATVSTPIINLPTVTTSAISDINDTYAYSGATLSNDGGSTVTSQGVCWSTSATPTLANSSSYNYLSPLMPSTTYYVRAYATNSLGTAYGNELSFTTIASPVIVTNAASSVTPNTALLGGSISYSLPSSISAYGICYSTSSAPTVSNSLITSGSGVGTFTSTLTGLSPNTTYYARAYIYKKGSPFYGNEISFTTSSPTLPVLTTTAASSISANGASSGGNITDIGGSSISSKGICWSTSSNPTISNNTIPNYDYGYSAFSSAISGLTTGTTYYIRAFATNSAGTGYGNEVSFTTVSLPTLTTTAASSILSTTAICGGNVITDGGAAGTSRGICWSTTPNPTIANSIASAGTGQGTFTANLSLLLPNTLYYVRAWAYNDAGYAYGSQVSFTTAALAVPTVNTNAVTNITTNTASSGGNIVDNGGSVITAKGVCWSTSNNPTLANSFTINGNGSSSFSTYVSSLIAGTTYYVRAYATNSTGTAYGNQVSFTTQPISVPVLSTSITYNSSYTYATNNANITNDGGSAITAKGICWSTSPNPTIADNTTNEGTGAAPYISTMNGLSANTTYYVRSYATNASGTGYGNQMSFTTPSILIGQTYQGGIVAYVLQAGDPGYIAGETHGLIATTNDISSGIQWFNGFYYTTFADGTSIGTGNSNTSAIFNTQGYGSYAATSCTTGPINGYSDWYLPSKDELNKLYINKLAIGGFVSYANYWTSSEYNNVQAFFQNFGNGVQSYSDKSMYYNVRAVRSF